NDYVSIRLWYSSGLTLTNNTCNKNYLGILLEYTSESNIVNNTCNNNTYGIYLWNSDSCLISYNLLQENIDYGVYLDYTSGYNILHHNIFVDNNQIGGSQAYDSGNNNTWYDVELLEGNYWSDLGTNCTYEIAGQAEAVDQYPLNRSQDCNIPHSKTTLIIVAIALSVFVSSTVLLLSYRYYKYYSRKK
ncbi:MAG: right-handed parallel beta-helix repeat-containing protein, partial [Candidatus Heimdallarchaeota archaeon]|nr:right-handed parallel beta-helix repeat-containing protein [Candidatus Heimdallarchaeota archaeon]MCK4254297.1 right-handed parallel beta-helix repeat-containing protein [Candidatus Heimdallarchaeota archaeon]